MAEKKVTIQSLLTEDNKKRLAELLLSDKITNMVILYRKGDSFHCDVSDQAWPMSSACWKWRRPQ